MIIESNFQKTFFAIVLYTKMAAVTSRKVSRDMLNCPKAVFFSTSCLSSLPLSTPRGEGKKGDSGSEAVFLHLES